MENYEKEPSLIEHHIDPNPFEAPQYFHMEVKKDKSAKTTANKVLKVFGPNKPIVLYAAGRGTAFAVSCAEIIKTYYKEIYQITRLGQVRTMETWAPTAAGLDPLLVTRTVPMIYILMSLEQLDDKEMGYQKSMGRRKDVSVLTMSDLSLGDELPTPQSPPTTKKERLTSFSL